MLELGLLLLAADAAAAAPSTAVRADVVCYATTSGSQLNVVVKKGRTPTRTEKLTPTDCPEGLKWSEAAAVSMCTFYTHYDQEQRDAFVELHGVSPTDVCEDGREAAGLSRRPE